MHTPETIDLFIQKRAAGSALQRIADEIGVSKTTLVAWKQKYALDILAAQQDAALEAQTTVRNTIAHRQARLDDTFERLAPIIDNFDPDEVTIMQAFRLFFLIQRETLKLQQLRFKLDLDTSKLHLPLPEKNFPQSNFGQVLERSDSPAGCNLSEHLESLQRASISKPDLRNHQPAVVEPFERSEGPRALSNAEDHRDCTFTPPVTKGRSIEQSKSVGLVHSSRKRSRNGQETRKPDPARDNFLSIISNPPQPKFLPPKSDNDPITHADANFLLLPSKLPKETLEIAHRILPKEVSPPNKNILFQQPQTIADLTKKFSDAAD